MGKLFCVLIGVSNYDNGWRPLPNATNDIYSIATAITKTHNPTRFELFIFSCKNSAPTKANIMALLGDLGRKLNAKDHLFFYFAGHGLLLNDEIYLLPQDAAAPTSLDIRTFISITEVISCFENSPCEQKLMLLDTCSSFLESINEKRLIRAYTKIETSRGWIILTASAPGMESYEVGMHGIFSEAVAQALRGAADMDKDGVVSLGEFVYFVSTRVRAKSLAYARKEQTPMLFASAIRMDLPVIPGAKITADSALPDRWRSRTPGSNFLHVWLKNSIKVPDELKEFFYPGFFVYGIGFIMFLILLFQGFAGGIFNIWFSLLIFIGWKICTALSFSAFERHWHLGGYLPSFLIAALLMCNFFFQISTSNQFDVVFLSFVMIETLFLVSLLALNALNTILSIYFLINRKEAVLVEYTFSQFDRKWFEINIPNILPCITARPLLYAIIGVAMSLLNVGYIITLNNIFEIATSVLLILLTWWIIGWYQSAFLAEKRRWSPNV